MRGVLCSDELIRGTSIRGRLVDEHEKPIVGAHVTVNAQSRACGAPVLDADGKWIGIAIATRGTGYVYVLNSIAIQEFLAPSR